MIWGVAGLVLGRAMVVVVTSNVQVDSRISSTCRIPPPYLP